MKKTKLCYQVATPEVRKSPSVTAYQGDLMEAFAKLGDLGYDGVELMVRDPSQLRPEEILSLARRNNLEITVLCTGEVYGQDKLSFMDVDAGVRAEALRRTKRIVDLASRLNAQVNIGRLRGQYTPQVPREISYQWALTAFKRVAEYGETKNVTIALEPINILQSNFINTTQDGMRIVGEVSSPRFRIMLDLFHMHIEDLDIEQSIEDSTGYVSNVHLTDSNRRIPGSCKMDFERILRKLHSTGYDGPLAVEAFQIPDQDTAMEKSIQFLKPILERLRGESEG